MVSIQETISFVIYFLSVYVIFFIVIFGLIGNLINVLVFTQLKLFRKNQSALYLTVISIVDCSLLLFTTIPRITTTVFVYDHTRYSIVWCKLRVYIAQFGSTISATNICFAAVDQFLSTSYYNRLRQLSTFTLTRRIVGILIVLTTFYCIPVAIFYEIRPTAGCATYNPSYNYYYSFVQFCILFGVLPITISFLFSLLAYRNVRRIIRRQIPLVRRRLDRQLTAMILVRVALYLVTTLPFVTLRMYQINNSVNQSNIGYWAAVNQLINITIITFYSVNYSGSFYVFWVTSTRFRRQVRYFFKKIWRKGLSMSPNRNQVAPESQRRSVENPLSTGEID